MVSHVLGRGRNGAYYTAAALAAVLASAAHGAPAREVGREQDFHPAKGEQQFYEGFLSPGIYLWNAHGAAGSRPDGSGEALNRYQLFLLDAFKGDALRFVSDTVWLSDRHRAMLKPASMDYLLGTWTRSGPFRVAFDREEVFPLDGAGPSSKYWDVRGSVVGGGDRASVAATLGYFLQNDHYAARPDGTGLARWRAAAHIRARPGRYLLSADLDMLSDALYRPATPASLDLSLGLGMALVGSEVWLTRESRQSLDGSGYAAYWILSAKVRFDSRNDSVGPP